MSVLKAEAAKREALMRTFQASGKSEAEFADMYGMNLALVSRVLARVRADEAQRADKANETVETVEVAQADITPT